MGRVSHSVEVGAPLEACYRVLLDFENYPLFMSRVEQISRKGDPKVLHWKVKGPNGQSLEWDAELDAVKHDNRVISWHTIRHADVPHSGAITLEDLGAKTRVNMVIDFTVPVSMPDTDRFMQVFTQAIRESLDGFKREVEQRQLVKY